MRFRCHHSWAAPRRAAGCGAWRPWPPSAIGALSGASGVVSASGEQPSDRKASTTDPRVGLKPGRTDAGVAAKNMELVSSMAKPAGFFDPKQPAGDVVPPEAPAGAAAPAATPPLPTPRRSRRGGEWRAGHRPHGGTGRRRQLPGLRQLRPRLQGRQHRDGQLPRLQHLRRREHAAAAAAWPRSSAPAARATSRFTATCCSCRWSRRAAASTAARRAWPTRSSAERFRGVRIFDITDLKQAEAGGGGADLPRLAHAHAGDRSEGQGATSTSTARAPATCAPARSWPAARARSPRRIRTPRSSASTSSRCRWRPREGGDRQPAAHLRRLRRPAPSPACGRAAITAPARSARSTTNQCHDITVFPEVGLAAGACSGNGILMDISDPVNPVRLDHVADKNFAYWHSATFNNDGTKIIFTDEWGGGTRPRCRATDLPQLGRRRHLRHRRQEAALRRLLQDAGGADRHGELRRAQRLDHPGAGPRHHGAGLVSGRLSVFDFTDSAKPVEIAYFDRGPIDAKQPRSPAATGRPTGTTATSTAPRSRAASTSSGCCRASTCRRTRSTRRRWCGCDGVQRAAAAAGHLAAELHRGRGRISIS